MPQIHGKNTRVFVDQFDLSKFLNEATMTAKVDMADTTTFAPKPGIAVAKTVIPGVKDGQIQLKGLFDPSTIQTALETGSSTGSDAYFHELLARETGVGTVLTPSNVEGCVSVSPSGSWATGTRVWAAANVVSSYQLSSPVKNAVTIQADFQSDGGVDTGVSLHDPETNDTVPTTINTASEAQTLPVTTLNASAAPTGYPSSGQLLVPLAAGGYAVVAYTGISTDTFTGCTGGTGATATSEPILVLNLGTGANDLQLPAGSSTTLAYGATPVGGTGLGLTTSSFTFETTANPFGVFPAAGQFLCPTSGGSVTVSYTGLSTTSPYGFTGCTVAEAATATASSHVSLPPITSVNGAYAFLHVGQVGGDSGGIEKAYLQHSDDNSTWTDVPGGEWVLTSNTEAQFGTGQDGVDPADVGGFILFIPHGTQINRYVRTAIAYKSGSTTPTTVLVTFVRL